MTWGRTLKRKGAFRIRFDFLYVEGLVSFKHQEEHRRADLSRHTPGLWNFEGKRKKPPMVN